MALGKNIVLICIDPNHVYYSHPRYRAALKEKLPCLGCGAVDKDNSEAASVASATTVVEKAN
jgi:hypothetical protein